MNSATIAFKPPITSEQCPDKLLYWTIGGNIFQQINTRRCVMVFNAPTQHGQDTCAVVASGAAPCLRSIVRYRRCTNHPSAPGITIVLCFNSLYFITFSILLYGAVWSITLSVSPSRFCWARNILARLTRRFQLSVLGRIKHLALLSK